MTTASESLRESAKEGEPAPKVAETSDTAESAAIAQEKEPTIAKPGSERSEPEHSAPEPATPEISEREITESETSEPQNSESEAAEPEFETADSATSAPEFAEPEATEPATAESEAAEPEASEAADSESLAPEFAAPGTAAPETAESGAAELELETADSATSAPEFAEPEATEPATAESEAAEPELETADSATPAPELAEPEATEPATTEPEAAAPETAEPETIEPELGAAGAEISVSETAAPEAIEPELGSAGSETSAPEAAESEAAEFASAEAKTSDALEDVEAGLDALETAPVHETGWLVAVLRAVYPPVLAILLIVAVWQVLYAAKIWPDWKLPGPSEVFTSLKGAFSSGDAWPSVGHSVEHGAIGFGASVAIGTPLGLLVGRVRAVRAGLGPILSGLQSLPSVAWVPPALMFFGPKPAMLYAVVLAGAVPSISVGVVSGLDQVPPLYLRVGRNLGARGLASVRYVLLPAALPGYLAGLRQGWAFSWRSLLAAEIIVESADLGHSLGFLLKNAQDSNDMAGAFAAIVLILAVGVAVNQLVFVPLERRVLRSRGLA